MPPDILPLRVAFPDGGPYPPAQNPLSIKTLAQARPAPLSGINGTLSTRFGQSFFSGSGEGSSLPPSFPGAFSSSVTFDEVETDAGLGGVRFLISTSTTSVGNTPRGNQGGSRPAIRKGAVFAKEEGDAPCHPNRPRNPSGRTPPSRNRAEHRWAVLPSPSIEGSPAIHVGGSCWTSRLTTPPEVGDAGS